MNRDDIIKLAREASGGMLSYDAEGNWRLNETEVAHFAALVRADERKNFCALLRQMHDAYALQSDPGPLRARGNHAN